MTQRLLEWPENLKFVTRSMVKGPRARGEGTENVEGGIQTTSTPLGLQEFELSVQPLREAEARAWRSVVIGLNGGYNAIRVPFFDPDVISPSEAGLVSYADQNWSDGNPWSGGGKWVATYPLVSVAAPAARQTTVISLADSTWGHRLPVGSWFGFSPLHLGLYHVTESIGFGSYRIWPPLRKAITTDDYATLRPVMAMTIRSFDAATLSRNPSHMEGMTIRLVEVPDYTIRAVFG